jgi:hypothetical protein
MKRGEGAILYGDDGELTGYLVLGGEEYEIRGRRISKIRTHIDLRQIVDETKQGDLFDENSSQSGERKRDLV